MEKTPLPSLLKEREAADLLGLSFRTLQSWRSRGGGPAYVRLGGGVRYDAHDLSDFIQSGRTAPTARNFR
jgi:predicted site-specific integrase-resolvase